MKLRIDVDIKIINIVNKALLLNVFTMISMGSVSKKALTRKSLCVHIYKSNFMKI